MNKSLTQHLLRGGALALPALALAQPSFTGLYPIGVEGLKSGTLPPPGFYLRDYNLAYYSDRLNDSRGDKVPVDVEAFVYANAIRPIWISDFQILGAHYGCDVLIPFLYKNVKVGNTRDDTFNLGDIFIEPLTLSWRWQRADAGVGYGIWAPTGDVDLNRVTGGTGQGSWTHMFTAGGTLYLDTTKSWALSALGRYEISHRSDDYDITPGDVLSLEGGLSKSFTPAFEAGIWAFYQGQMTDDEAHGSAVASTVRDHLVGVGPEAVWFWQKPGLFVSLRYSYEVLAENRTEGHRGTLTLTKNF